MVGSEAMKFSTNVTSSRRKQRCKHFSSSSSARRRLMSATLSKDLREKYNCRAIPVCKEDEVKIMTGKLKGREGRVTQVYRKRFYIIVDRVNRTKSDGQTEVSVPIHPSNVMITNIKETPSRLKILERRGAGAKHMDVVD
uniref:50S ribosomal protein L24, chloroplastic n=1 Tax=Cyclophora tenuis TaxID=216820 RepID=A0A7S1GLB9_CYCTE